MMPIDTTARPGECRVVTVLDTTGDSQCQCTQDGKRYRIATVAGQVHVFVADENVPAMNRERAIAILSHFTPDQREACAVIVETTNPLECGAGTNEDGSDIFEDDCASTLEWLAKEFRGG